MKNLFGLGLVMLFLSGCAIPVKPVEFDPVANQNIRTIGLIEVSSPLEYTVVQSATAENTQKAVSFLVGGLLTLGGAVMILPRVSVNVAPALTDAEGILTKEISDSGFNGGRQMTEELTKALQNVNYKVVTPSTSNVDAKLDAVQAPLLGYRYSGVSGAEVSPLIVVNIRLISPNGAVLYFPGTIGYGNACSACSQMIKPSERYYFDLTKPENKPLIIEGLQAGIAAIAEKVAADLRK